MPNGDTLSQEMDGAAENAKAELKERFDSWSARDLAAWWSKWYLITGP